MMNASSHLDTEADHTIELLRQHLPDILQDRPVLVAYVYGSVPAGCPTPLSDVDVALVLAPHCGLDSYQQFMVDKGGFPIQNG